MLANVKKTLRTQEKIKYVISIKKSHITNHYDSNKGIAVLYELKMKE